MSCDCHKRLPQGKHEPGCDTQLGGLAFGVGTSALIARCCGLTRAQFIEFAAAAWKITVAKEKVT